MLSTLFALAGGAPGSAHAVMCGVNIVQLTLCETWLMPEPVFRALIVAATKGDNAAANRLADLYAMAGDGQRALAWRMMAARRGDCGAIGSLMNRNDDRYQQGRWKRQFSNRHCSAAYAEGAPLQVYDNSMPVRGDGLPH